MKKIIFVAALVLLFALALFPSLALADGAYEQLKNDIASAPADGTETLVTLSGDIANFETADILTIEAGQNIVLDMNGHSITVASDFEGRPFVNNGRLTVKGDGKIDSSASASGGLGAINNYGTLVIENGTFVGAKYASGSCIRNSGSSAELYIKDGTFKGATCAIYNLNYAVIDGGTYIGSTCSQCKKIWSYTIRNHAVGAVMVINDGYFEGVQGAASSAVGKLTVNGGTFKTVECSVNESHTAIFYALYAAGEVGEVECYINGGDFSTVGSNAAVLIGNDNKGGDGGIRAQATAYVTGGTFTAPDGVPALKGAAETGDPIITGGTFSSDVSEYVSGAAGLIDDDGKFVVKLKGNEGAVASVERGSDTLYYTDLAKAVAEIRSGETITLLDDITLSSTLTINTGAAFTIDLNGHDIKATQCVIMVERGNVSFTGEGTIAETSPNYGAINIKGSNDSGDVNYTTVTVDKDVTLVAWAPVFITPNESSGVPNAYGVTVNIEGTLISKPDTSGDKGHGIYINGQIKHLNNAPVINVSGASVTSEGYGIYAAGYATWSIEDSSITGKVTGVEIRAGVMNISGSSQIIGLGSPTTVEANGNGTTTCGAGIAVAQHTTGLPIELAISGGTISGYTALNESNPQKNGQSQLDKIEMSISGGEFKTIKGGKTAVRSEDKASFITGGSYDSSVAEYVSESMKYELNNGGTFSYYTNLNDALDAAEEGAVISDLGEGASTVFYRLAVSYGNGQNGIDVKLPAGTEYKLPAAPSKVGYIFMGWKCSDGHTYQANETVTVEKDMTFTAVWSALPDIEPGQPSQPDEPETPDFPFTDVSVNAWYYEAVKYVYENGIMNGMDRYSFQPNGTLTRAMIWTMLARFDGVDTEGGNSWYAKAQEWATATGVSDGENPTGEVTREQLVTMLWRYAGSPTYTADLSGYVDTADISSWAEQAMCWAVATGVIEGDENSALTPKADTTRAQAAAMLMRSIEA
ncbi:MAG: S-layer homology domain-containing protein [Oscillospiraceae bacterium]